ncbi:putative RNA-directed DNA polymerase [Arabidopsis thaliana]
MKDYRPISCCNILYKVISKIIANRLKLVFPKFIAGNQSAFVKDRLLIENVLLATEIVKDYHKDSVSSRCALKIDISKAFDSVQWKFLINVLEAMNFPPEFTHWITLCITTASFSVQVNGELAGVFSSARGLRQGCSLSPYLFVISMDVQSKMLDKAVGARQFGYHPKCRAIGLTHLSFADDLMILSDGKVRSIDGIVKVLDEFAKWSGLKISMEKSTMYLAGVQASVYQEIVQKFSFDVGKLPVRYLGLPLVSKRLTASDCLPLIEQLRKKIEAWTSRFLSFDGRLNLISSTLWSICNFWMAAFRLPRACIREIDKLCSTFLWSAICKPKKEGGLGLRSLKEANEVCCLKLIWRIVSHSNSLWVKWTETTLLKRQSFWSLKTSSVVGSWIWKKLLKYRDMAKTCCKVDVGDGNRTSFWYDDWSIMGRIVDLSVAEAWSTRRRRQHRTATLNQIEIALHLAQQNRRDAEDVVLWRGENDVFTPTFSTKDTWNNIRTTAPEVAWHKGVWFAHETPKHSFCVWLAIWNRLSTGQRMQHWNLQSSVGCVLCNNNLETRDHLFFSCAYTSGIWEALAKNLLQRSYTTNWQTIISYVSGQCHDRVSCFLARSVLQASVYTIWRERNGRRHGETPNPAARLIQWIDKHIRNMLSVIHQKGDKRYDKGLQMWFAYRS